MKIRKRSKRSDAGKPQLDLIGQQFGRLLVVSQAPSRKSRIAWNCVCQVDGNAVVVTSHELRAGHTKSCGCIRKEVAAAQFKRLAAKHTGPAHPAWNPDLSVEDRVRKRRCGHTPTKKYIAWHKAVFAKCGGRCYFCGSTTARPFRAHHVYSWSAYPKYRYRVSNGSVLCEECHKAYHKLAGHRAPTTRKHFNSVKRSLQTWLMLATYKKEEADDHKR